MSACCQEAMDSEGFAHRMCSTVDAKLTELRERAEKAEADNAEVHRVFDQWWSRSQRAIALWQAEKPDERALTWPDHGRLIEWLIARGDAAEAEVKRLRHGYGLELMDTTRELALALGMEEDPEYGFPTGDHTTVTLAAEVRRALEALREQQAAGGEWLNHHVEEVPDGQ